MVKVKILGLSLTPIKDGNCDKMVQEGLKACTELGDVETEFITLADKEYAICEHSQWCIENMSPCRIKDDAYPIYDKIGESDGLILGSPTWMNTLSPFLVNFFSRARYVVFFTHKFRNKPVALLTLGFLGYGLDNAISVMKDVVWTMNMMPVAIAKGIASSRVFGKRPEYLEHGVLDDTFGMVQTRQAGYRVVEVARMIKYAQDNGIGVPDEYKFVITGGRVRPPKGKVFVEGVWREKA
jgi:multimeric flavodoxin WrbA